MVRTSHQSVQVCYCDTYRHTGAHTCTPTHTHFTRYRVVEHYLRRCHCNFDLLEKFNLIGRISEFARLYGIEFENVTARGTQYRVESMMLRLAKPANYIAVSPSVQQRARCVCVSLTMVVL